MLKLLNVVMANVINRALKLKFIFWGTCVLNSTAWKSPVNVIIRLLCSFFLIAKLYYLKQCVVGMNSGFRYQEVTVLNQNLNYVSIISICQSVFYIFFQWQENTTPIFKFSIIPSFPFMSSNCNLAWSFRSSQPPFQHY